jgi:ATP-binding cassette subfamily C protein CydC
MNRFTPSALVRPLAILRTAERVAGHEATLRIVVEVRAWLFARSAPTRRSTCARARCLRP